MVVSTSQRTLCARLWLTGALTALVVLAGSLTPGSLALADEYELGELQVELRAGASVTALNARHGTTTLDSLPPLYLLDLPDSAGEGEYIDQLLADPDIVEAEYSWEGETPEGTRQMMVAAVGGTISDYLDQNLVQRIHLEDIHAHTKGDGVLVAVIDTGVLATHEALEGAVLMDGYDFVDNDTDPTDAANGIDEDLDGNTDEGAGHGTMVAGIIHLMAPNARILPIRVLDDEGQGTTFRVAKGIRYAVEHGADVINLSLGLTSVVSVIRHEIRLADSLSVAVISAAGNMSVEEPAYYPASDSKVLSVTALDSSDVKADFSNWNESVDLSAPGVGILAPFHDGEYAIGAGTSFAAPFVAGQCALILAMNPYLVVDDVYQIARLGVVDISQIPGNEQYQDELGTGRIDGLETWLQIPPAAGIAEGAWRGEPFAGSSGMTLSVSPNPVLDRGPVRLTLESAQPLTSAFAAIHDATGRRVCLLTGRLEAGSRAGAVEWNGRDDSGRAVPSGTYFIRLEGTTRSGKSRVEGRLTRLGS